MTTEVNMREALRTGPGRRALPCYSVFVFRENEFESVRYSAWLSSALSLVSTAVARIQMIHVKSWHIVGI